MPQEDHHTVTEINDLPAISVDVDDHGVITIRGDLDVATAPMAARIVAEHAHEGADTVLDLGELAFMDSSGLRVLLVAANRAAKNGNAVRIRAVTPAVERLLAFTGTSELFVLPGARTTGAVVRD